MKKILVLSSLVFWFFSCGSSAETQSKDITSTNSGYTSTKKIAPFFDIEEQAPDAEYGFSESNPIKVGGFETRNGPTNQQRYIASLAGPDGEVLSFKRLGSCCPYPSEKGFDGTGMLDIYSVTYDGLETPIKLYISFYDYEKLYLPNGFTKAR